MCIPAGIQRSLTTWYPADPHAPQFLTGTWLPQESVFPAMTAWHEGLSMSPLIPLDL